MTDRLRSDSCSKSQLASSLAAAKAAAPAPAERKRGRKKKAPPPASLLPTSPEAPAVVEGRTEDLWKLMRRLSAE